jgi:hypothetical protein
MATSSSVANVSVDRVHVVEATASQICLVTQMLQFIRQNRSLGGPIGRQSTSGQQRRLDASRTNGIQGLFGELPL